MELPFNIKRESRWHQWWWWWWFIWTNSFAKARLWSGAWPAVRGAGAAIVMSCPNEPWQTLGAWECCTINFPFLCIRPFQCVFFCVRQAIPPMFICCKFSGLCSYVNFQSKTSRWCEFRWITIGPILTLSVHNLAPKPWKLWMRVTVT